MSALINILVDSITSQLFVIILDKFTMFVGKLFEVVDLKLSSERSNIGTVLECHIQRGHCGRCKFSSPVFSRLSSTFRFFCYGLVFFTRDRGLGCRLGTDYFLFPETTTPRSCGHPLLAHFFRPRL